MRNTADAEESVGSEFPVELNVAMAVAGSIQDVPCSSVSTAIKSHDIAREVQRKEFHVKFSDGTSRPVKPKDFFKAEYKDEYTGEALPEPEVHAAIIDELEYVAKHVFVAVPVAEAKNDVAGKIIGTRWVNCNKGDASNPDVRCRLVAQEVAQEADASFYAATPPLEAKRVLFSQWATEQSRGGKLLKLSFVDIRKAYFNGLPTRSLYIRLPMELGLPRDVVGRLVRCCYGTRDAGQIWEDCYVHALESLGFMQGSASPCSFYHSG